MKRFLSVFALCLGLVPVVMAAGVDLNQHGLTGSWYEPASGGQGVELEVFPNMSSPGTGYAFLSWFTYDTFVGGAERQRWYTVEGPVVTGQPNAKLTIYQNTGGNFNAPPTTTAHPVGTATLSFDSCTTGLLSYNFADGTGRTGSIPLTRLTQSITCSTTGAPLTNTDFSLSGNWYDPATSGQGITVEVNAGSKALFLAWYTFAPNGAGAGPAGQRWYTAQAEFTPDLRSMPVTIYQTTGGVFDTPTPPGQKTVQVGTGTMAFQSCSAATLSYHFTGGSSSGASGTIALTRVGPVPPGCAVLAAPSNLVATVVSGRSVYSINLTWTDNSSNETGFKIERSASPSSGFQEIATVGANVTTYSITGTSAPPPRPHTSACGPTTPGPTRRTPTSPRSQPISCRRTRRAAWQLAVRQAVR